MGTRNEQGRSTGAVPLQFHSRPQYRHSPVRCFFTFFIACPPSTSSARSYCPLRFCVQMSLYNLKLSMPKD
eukprot:3032497-Pleurochrysis_carterae.AAC.3